MRVMIASGMFDGIFPCVQTQDLARRELQSYEDRTRVHCYAGGHMMYYDVDVAARLADDVRAFLQPQE